VKKRVFYLTAAVALACTSCGNGIYPVSGKVTYKGRPAAGAAVFFQRQGVNLVNEPMIMGLVQQDGSFSVVCGDKGAGAPPGEYDVLIEWRPPSSQPKGLAQNASDRLGGRYADPKNPRLHAQIKAGTNNLPPFELTD
jgi:hypothetical protein